MTLKISFREILEKMPAKCRLLCLYIFFLHFAEISAQSPVMESLPFSVYQDHALLDSVVKEYRSNSIKSFYRDETYKAMIYGLETVKMYEALGDSSNLCWSYNLIGSIYQAHGKYDKSIEYLERGYTLAKKISDTGEIVRSINNLGTVYAQKEAYATGLGYLQEGLVLARTIQNRSNQARFYYNIATYYSHLDKYNLVRTYLDSCITLCKSIDERFVLPNAIDLYAFSYLEEGEYKKSRKLSTQSLLIYKANIDTYKVVNAYNKLTRVALRQSDFKAARAYSDSLVKLAEGFFPNLMADHWQIWHNSFLKRKDWKLAYQYQARYLAINDSLENATREEQWTMLEMVEAHEKSKLEKETSALLALNASNQSLLRVYIIALIIGLVLLVSIFWVLLRLRRSKLHLELNRRSISEKNKQLKNALIEKEVLIKEVHHRVKNNLQMISSMLAMQAMTTDNHELERILEEGQNRIESMALIHQQLYQREDFQTIDSREYVLNLIEHLKQVHPLASIVEFQVEVDKEINLGLDTVIPLGLIINELISNCLKYAFGEDGGGIQLFLSRNSKSDYVLSVKDDGVGFPSDFDLSTSKSLGMKLVHILTQQIGGELTFSSDHGAFVEVRFNALI